MRKRNTSEAKLFCCIKFTLPLVLPTIAYLPTLLYLMLYSTKEMAYANDPIYQNITDPVAFTCQTPDEYNAWGYSLGGLGYLGNAAFSGLMIYDLQSETQAQCPACYKVVGFIALWLINLSGGMLNAYNNRNAGQYFSGACRNDVSATTSTITTMLIAMATPALASTKACIRLTRSQYQECQILCTQRMSSDQSNKLIEHYGLSPLINNAEGDNIIPLSNSMKSKMQITLLALLPALGFSIYACLYYIDYTDKFTAACCTDWSSPSNPCCNLQLSALPGILSFIINTFINTLLYKGSLIYPLQRCKGASKQQQCEKKMIGVYLIVLMPSISIAIANLYLANKNKQLSITNRVITTVATPVNLFVFCMAGLGEILLKKCAFVKERGEPNAYKQLRQ